MESCIFCRIASGEIPVEFVHETANTVVFNDRTPQAPLHLLIIPRSHIANVNDVTQDNQSIAGEMLVAAAQAASKLGVAESGYRLVINTNRDAGQEVFHIHAHLFAGRRLKWPPC
jgi:histidine triad (HIT) family protein